MLLFLDTQLVFNQEPQVLRWLPLCHRRLELVL
jgi:hypothetical protein